jgi:signal transduction histidine kinase
MMEPIELNSQWMPRPLLRLVVSNERPVTRPVRRGRRCTAATANAKGPAGRREGAPAADASQGGDGNVPSMISQELSVPIAALRISADLLLNETATAEQRAHLLSIVHRQALRIERLVGELADVLHRERGGLESA